MPQPGRGKGKRSGFARSSYLSGTLSRTGRSIAVGLGRRLGERGLSFAQYLVLVRLWRAEPEPIGQAELVSDLAVERSSLSTLLAGLEAGGLVTRRAHPGDRRRLLVEVTDAGRRLELPVQRIVDAYEADLLSGLDDHRRAAAGDLLERLQSRAFELRSLSAGGA